MPQIAGWKKTSDKPKYQVWQSRESRVKSDKSHNQQSTSVSVGFDPKARAEDWIVQINRPYPNPRVSGFDSSKKEFDTKCEAETYAINWMRNHEY